jgi:hypothetical protein
MLCGLHVALLRRDYSALDLTLKSNNHKSSCGPTIRNTNNILPFSAEAIGWLDGKSKMAISPVQVSNGATIHRFGEYRPDLGSARPYIYCVPSVLRATTRARHATPAAILRRQIFSTLQTREASYPPTRGRSKTLIFTALPQLQFQPQLVLSYGLSQSCNEITKCFLAR